jgi:hypothetical protein
MSGVHKQNPENWVSYYKEKKPVRQQWILKLPQLSSEIWFFMISHMSLISKLKFCSTCKIFNHYFTSIHREKLKCLFDDNDYSISIPECTHIVSNLPLRIMGDTENFNFCFHCENFVQKIHFSEIEHQIKMCADNCFWYLEIPTIVCEIVSISHYNTIGIDITEDSEIIWKRQSIIDKLPFRCIHSSHVSMHIRGDTYLFLVCTKPLFFSKK